MSEFKYRVVFFHSNGCPACDAMRPIWSKVAGEVSEEYPELAIGWGEFNVLDDNWEFLESLVPGTSGQGTPEFAIFDSDSEMVAFNGEGIMAASQLKDFVITSIQGS